jgi:hypothetical protein
VSGTFSSAIADPTFADAVLDRLAHGSHRHLDCSRHEAGITAPATNRYPKLSPLGCRFRYGEAVQSNERFCWPTVATRQAVGAPRFVVTKLCNRTADDIIRRANALCWSVGFRRSQQVADSASAACYPSGEECAASREFFCFDPVETRQMWDQLLPKRLSIKVLVIALLTLAALPAHAGCGAIVVSLVDNSHYAAGNLSDCDKAQQNAMQQCRQKSKGNCELGITCDNECCALAVSSGKAFQSARGSTAAEAGKVALDACTNARKGKDCSIKVAFCNRANQ